MARPHLLLLICPIVATCLSLPACRERAAAETPRTKGNGPALVDVMIASPRSVNNKVEANGNVVANEYVELHPEISGRLIYLNVPEGTWVAEGTIIARINDADLQATLAKSKVLLALYQKTVERDQKLLDINGLNQADYDVAVSNVSSTKADIDYTQAQIDKTIIRAPFGGTVGLRQVSPGAYVTPASVIATVQQLDKIKVDFTLPEQYTAVIRKGSIVDIEVDAASNVHRKGTVIATEPQINLSSRNVKVRALLQDGKGNPGAFVKVYVDAGVDKKAIMVPTNCIIPDDKNNQLIVVRNGLAKFVNVQTGIREANDVEITRGVDPGDTLVVTGVLFARPDAPLQVRSVLNNDKVRDKDKSN